MTSGPVAMAMPALPAQAQVGIQSPGILPEEDAVPMSPPVPKPPRRAEGEEGSVTPGSLWDRTPSPPTSGDQFGAGASQC